jgi:hypothetical protein
MEYSIDLNNRGEVKEKYKLSNYQARLFERQANKEYPIA